MQIYFFNSAMAQLYQNDIIPVAEGLKELGYSFHARHDYWREEPDGEFLFKAADNVAPEDCDLVIGTFMLFGVSGADQSADQAAFIKLMSHRSAKTKLVFMDDTDGYTTPSWRPEFRGCDVILRTKYNSRAYAPKNMRPWAIGLVNRTLRMASSVPEAMERRRAIYVNYGASHHYEHSTRRKAKDLLHPALSPELETYAPPFVDISAPPADAYDRLMWEQTGKRHSRAYFERMKSCLVSSAFCGEEIPAAPWNPHWIRGGGLKARFGRKFFRAVQRFDPRPLRVVSGDSFRFWESLACGTVPMQVDFEHYGLRLPVQPVAYEHYLPARFDDLSSSVSQIKRVVPRMQEISSCAQHWAQQHYSPVAAAKRMLEHVS
jgi:hypothetical protein